MKRMLRGLFAVVAGFVLYAPGAFAQVDRATLTGVVKDSAAASYRARP